MAEHGLFDGSEVVLRVAATPRQANKSGRIFGGWIMSQVDIAGSIPAHVRAQGPIVTRAVQSFEFKKPVFVGDLISCYTELIKEGRSSIHIKVKVFAQRLDGMEMETVQVTEAVLVYVAIDEAGQPRSLPPMPSESGNGS